jgi:Rrf2 family protein
MEQAMKFSTQEEYGLRCLLAIARAPKGRVVTISVIARDENLSEPHVAKLLMSLRKNGFIVSLRGHAGGYVLSRDPSDIVLGDVLEALGGRLYGNGFCRRHSGLSPICVHKSDCSLRSLWFDVQTAVDSVLYRRTLAELLAAASDAPKPAIRVTLSRPLLASARAKVSSE